MKTYGHFCCTIVQSEQPVGLSLWFISDVGMTYSRFISDVGKSTVYGKKTKIVSDVDDFAIF